MNINLVTAGNVNCGKGFITKHLQDEKVPIRAPVCLGLECFCSTRTDRLSDTGSLPVCCLQGSPRKPPSRQVLQCKHCTYSETCTTRMELDQRQILISRKLYMYNVSIVIIIYMHYILYGILEVIMSQYVISYIILLLNKLSISKTSHAKTCTCNWHM